MVFFVPFATLMVAPLNAGMNTGFILPFLTVNLKVHFASVYCPASSADGVAVTVTLVTPSV